MGTRQGGSSSRDATRPASRKAAKAPRMAQDGLAAVRAELGQPGGRGAVLGQIWKPQPLSVPARVPFDDSIDDLDAHIAQRIRLRALVKELCERYRWSFRYADYAPGRKDSNTALATLLVEYGGLPRGMIGLNTVPAAVLRQAVDQFAECFGLGGNLRGSGSIPAEVDPQARIAEQAPW